MSENVAPLASDNLFACARQCLECADPTAKCELTERVVEALRAGQLGFESVDDPQVIGAPGRPVRPHLVAPRNLPRRRLGGTGGRASLLHALVHIEFNAINLAWDAVYRFRDMPEAFYVDWARVACEEAYHFRMLCERLADYGHAYGDFDAHDGLWEMACRTAHDPLVRMALVPRVLEARGLDVTPGMIQRLEQAGDGPVVDVLKIILRDEIGHVAIGTRWFRYLCNERDLDPDVTFVRLVQEYMQGRVKRPFHYAAREKAGFNAVEMEYLETLATGNRVTHEN
ncbi:MAG: ferritin-like domain-containing protein [Gammaproteobacteria bacterium]|nr:MAG: ferritin-like domain-containing protein [Gammaproteobacteria bacterium]